VPLVARQNDLASELEPTARQSTLRKLSHYAVKVFVYAALAFWWWETKFFAFKSSADFLLHPIRWFLPNWLTNAVGVVPWILICTRISKMVADQVEKLMKPKEHSA